MHKRNNKKLILFFGLFTLMLVTGIYYFSGSSTIYFYIENDTRINDGSIEVVIDSVILRDKLLKKEWPYKFLEPLNINRGFSKVNISIDKSFQSSEKLFFYRKTHYVKVMINYETKEIHLINTGYFIMYQ